MSTERSTLYQAINGREYRKSSFSSFLPPARCVGVSFDRDKIFVINTNSKDGPIEFSNEEWRQFIKGVKAGEFEVDS